MDRYPVPSSAAFNQLEERNNFSCITIPGKSPDFSILESLAHVYKRRFHTRTSNTVEQGLDRFEEIFHNEVDQEAIRRQYDGYAARFQELKDVIKIINDFKLNFLHACSRKQGQVSNTTLISL